MLVPANLRPVDVGPMLTTALDGMDDVLAWGIEAYGVPDDDVTEAALISALVEETAQRLRDAA